MRAGRVSIGQALLALFLKDFKVILAVLSVAHNNSTEFTRFVSDDYRLTPYLITNSNILKKY